MFRCNFVNVITTEIVGAVYITAEKETYFLLSVPIKFLLYCNTFWNSVIITF